MAFLGKEELTRKRPLEIEKVELEGDDFTFVRQMTGRNRDDYEQSLMVEEKVKDKNGNETGEIRYVRSLKDFRAKMAVNTVCDENGNLVFEPEDYVLLSTTLPAPLLEKIVRKAQELNKMGPEDTATKTKNFNGAQPDDSTSGLPEN